MQQHRHLSFPGKIHGHHFLRQGSRHLLFSPDAGRRDPALCAETGKVWLYRLQPVCPGNGTEYHRFCGHAPGRKPRRCDRQRDFSGGWSGRGYERSALGKGVSCQRSGTERYAGEQYQPAQQLYPAQFHHIQRRGNALPRVHAQHGLPRLIPQGHFYRKSRGTVGHYGDKLHFPAISPCLPALCGFRLAGC